MEPVPAGRIACTGCPGIPAACAQDRSHRRPHPADDGARGLRRGSRRVADSAHAHRPGGRGGTGQTRHAASRTGHVIAEGGVKADAIKVVTEALRDRLKAALVSSGVPGTVFVGPLDDGDSSGAALILFLYRISPNPSLRNREHRVATGGTPPVREYHN